MAVVGGLASVWGALFGAGIIMLIDQYVGTVVKAIIPKASGEYEIIAFGFILIIIMIFMPSGIWRGLGELLRKLTGLRQEKTAGQPTADV